MDYDLGTWQIHSLFLHFVITSIDGSDGEGCGVGVMHEPAKHIWRSRKNYVACFHLPLLSAFLGLNSGHQASHFTY